MSSTWIITNCSKSLIKSATVAYLALFFELNFINLCCRLFLRRVMASSAISSQGFGYNSSLGSFDSGSSLFTAAAGLWALSLILTWSSLSLLSRIGSLIFCSRLTKPGTAK